jgi:hypothetical protein
MCILLLNSILTISCILTGACSYSKTPSSGKRSKIPIGGDRFIPVRSATNFELAHYKEINMLVFRA